MVVKPVRTPVIAPQGRRFRVAAGHSKDNSNGRSKPGRIVLTGRASGQVVHPQDRVWGRMHHLRRITQRSSVRMCGTALGGAVRIQREGSNRATLIGTMRCGSPAVCPRCNAAISRKRVDTLSEALVELKATGHIIAMAAFTFQHHRTSLVWGLDLILKSWSDMFAGRRLATFAALGMVGCVRTIEATHGTRNGWHPHIHALFILAPGANLDAIRAHLVAEWAKRVPCSIERGVYFATALDARKSAGYIAKGAGNEVMLGADKGSMPGRIHPFELLDRRSDRATMLWREWETAVRGRRFLGWTARRAVELALGRKLELADTVPDEVPADNKQAVELGKSTWLDCLRWGMVADVLRLIRRGLDTSPLVAYDQIRSTSDNGCAETLRLCLRC